MNSIWLVRGLPADEHSAMLVLTFIQLVLFTEFYKTILLEIILFKLLMKFFFSKQLLAYSLPKI